MHIQYCGIQKWVSPSFLCRNYVHPQAAVIFVCSLSVCASEWESTKKKKQSASFLTKNICTIFVLSVTMRLTKKL